jgi:hypothetical protein
MPESLSSNQPFASTNTTATAVPIMPTKDLPTPDMPTMDTLPPITSMRRRLTRESPIDHPKPSTPTSEKSSSSDLEELDALTPKQEKLRKLLQQRYVTVGGILTAFDPYGGMVVIQKSEERSMEAVKAARHNKRVWEVLEKIVYGGDGFAFFLGHGLMIFALLVHAKRIKSNPQIDAVLAMSGYSEDYIMMNAMLEHAGEQGIPGSQVN